MFTHRWGGDRGAPVQGEVVGGQPFREVPCGIKGSEGGERGERGGEPGGGRVVGGRGACDSEGGQSPSVTAIGVNGREAGLACKDGGGG